MRQRGEVVKCPLIKGYATYDDNMPYEQYCKWQKECLQEMFRLIKDTGAIFYNHKWRVQDGLIQDRREIVQDFPIRQIIIWRRKGGINFNARYFLPTYEVIYLIAKWKHDKAGTKYPASERSFRMTINGQIFTDRGFKINVNRAEEKIEVVFDSTKVAERH